MEFIVYRRVEFKYVWCVYSIEENRLIFIRCFKKNLGKKTLKDLFSLTETDSLIFNYVNSETSVDSIVNWIEGNSPVNILFTL